VDDDDILNALFGTLQLAFSPGQAEPIPIRRRDGAFMGPDGPWNTRVTGVVIASLYPWGLGAGRFELYHNPWTANQLGDCRLPIRQARRLEEGLEWTEGPRLLDLFGLPDGWPYQPAA
jgi:hypothetical protein